MHKDKPETDKERYPVSRALLELSRIWVYMALAALVLYFIVAAIERSKLTFSVTTVRSYHVPIERDPAESEAE